MSKLCYEPRSESKLIQQSEIYPVFSSYQDKELKERFQQLKANVCDLNPALVAKCITGTEQDFILLMNRAKDFIRERFRQTSMEEEKRLLQMFKECVFGYYVLTPLIEAKEVSDIKVLDYNHIVVKAKGKRYIADCSFYSPSDYNDWFMRILRIQRMGKSDDAALSHSTDRKGVKDYFLRIDTQLGCITSTEKNNIHIRKIPKQKLSWDYLKENGIPSMIYYPKSMHDQVAFQNYPSKVIETPNAEDLCDRVLALPMHPYLSKKDINEVVDRIKSFFNNKINAKSQNNQ